jgi:putative membrane protein
LGILLIYAVIAVFIGLVLRIPFVKMNHMIEKSKEKSGVMI